MVLMLLQYYDIRTLKRLQMCIYMSNCIHTHYIQVIYRRGRLKHRLLTISKCRPAGWIHGPNPLLGRKNLADQIDPTRDMICISQVIRSVAGRVGSGGVQTLTGQVGSGPEGLKYDGSGRVG